MSSPQAGAKKSKHEDRLKKALDLKFNRQFQEAEKILKKIHKEDPKNEDALLAMAEIQADTGRYPVALNNLAKIVRLNPSHAKAWRHMGFIELTIKSNLETAMEFLSRALNADPTDAETYRLMGVLCQQMNQFDDAIEMFEVGLQLSPRHPMMLSQLAMSYMRQRHFEKAKEKTIQAVQLAPDNANIIMNAMRLADLVNLDSEQQKIIDKAIQLNLKNPMLSNFIHIRNAQQQLDNGEAEEALKTLENVKENAANDAMLKYFQLGKVYRKLKNDKKAFACFKKGNELQASLPIAKKYRKGTLPFTFELEHKVLSKDFAQKLQNHTHKLEINRSYPDPVFLVGFPRSGTTLSGQILDNHPDIITTDEYGALDILKIHFQHKFKKRIPDCLSDINTEELQFMHDLYNEKQSNEPVKYKDKVFIDKMPLNSANMTLIHALFPNAKILFAKRHPLDSILSGYMQCFSMNSAMVHFNDIEDMAKIYKVMMDLWVEQKEIYPIQYYEYKYEDIVNDFDTEAKKILDFLGVGWNDSVRDFHKADLASGPKTLTPSRTQVSKGLYKTAQNRWKKYEEHLKPAIDILGDTIEKLGYEV